MTVEFIGIAATQESSEVIAPSGPVVQPDYLRRLALAHEASGFDRILVAHSAAMPDGLVVADQILNSTDRLGVLLAHRPGFTAPTIAARQWATLDAFHPGRVAVHIISGGDDADQRRDGDWEDKPARYRRSGEFLDVVRREWESTEPFDFDGEFYRVQGASSSVRPPAGRIPVYFGGASEDAVRVGSQHADVYAFWGEPLEGIRERIADVRAAAPPGREHRFSVSLRPIAASTEDAAWERAHEILRITEERVAEYKAAFGVQATNEGSTRLLKFAEKGDLHDRRLWTATAKATGAAGNSTALVGSYEQVAEALLEYVAIGVTTLLIRGYSPLVDAIDYGHLVSLVREHADAAPPLAVAASA